MVVQWESEAMNIVELREALALAHVEIGALKAENERLRLEVRAQEDLQKSYIEKWLTRAAKVGAEMERLQAPPTEAEVEAAARYLAKRWLGSEYGWRHYEIEACGVLEAAAKVREGE